jgi:hypothetical protein
MKPVRLLIILSLVAFASACGDDDGNGNGGDDPDAGATACLLPVETIDCTAGDNAPCVAECAEAFCRNFMHTGEVCTSPCDGGDDCPEGWSCNNMGFCRPPG